MAPSGLGRRLDEVKRNHEQIISDAERRCVEVKYLSVVDLLALGVENLEVR